MRFEFEFDQRLREKLQTNERVTHCAAVCVCMCVERRRACTNCCPLLPPGAPNLFHFLPNAHFRRVIDSIVLYTTRMHHALQQHRCVVFRVYIHYKNVLAIFYTNSICPTPQIPNTEIHTIVE